MTHVTARLLRALVAVAVGGLFAAGLFLHGGVGGVLLLLVAGLLVALTSMTWAGLHPRGRAARVVVLAGVVAAGVAKLLS